MTTEPQRGDDQRIPGTSFRPHPGTRLNDQNPWPGLDSYDESSAHFFHGRDGEAVELLRLVRLAPLTALYGKSGLGKTSLLQAGLFPLLRQQHYLPIYLHIDFSMAAVCPLEQIANRFQEELARAEAEFPERANGEGLWEYLHRNDMEIRSKDNFPLEAVLVFDQFEELFHHKVGEGSRIQLVRDSLADLIVNCIPAELARDAAKAKRSQLNLLSQRYRVILSFREDYLPELKAWEKDVPSLLRNYLRLEPLTRKWAIEVVEGPGQAVLEPGVASSIVDFVGNIGKQGKENTEAVIEPVLLCLFCYQLNRRRTANEKITKGLIESAGQDILNSYYETALNDPEMMSGPDVAEFIETYLIQGDRFRGNYPRQEAIDGNLLSQTQLHALTDRHRLVRVVQYQDTARIELIHDRLVEVACHFRNERKAKERLAEQERQAVQRARTLKRKASAIIAVFAVMLVIVGYLYISLWVRTRPWATLDSAVTGQRYRLRQDVAHIGRPAGLPVILQVALAPESITRLHMMVFRSFTAIDNRSLYGTTVNGEFLPYGDSTTLKDNDVIVLAGTAAFVFHPIEYKPWHLFSPPRLSNAEPPTGWGLLIDSKRHLVFPLTHDEEFIMPQGEDGVEPRERPEGAIAVVRQVEVRGKPGISWDRVMAERFWKRDEDPPTGEVELVALTPSRPSDVSAACYVLTIEDITGGDELQVDIKLDDYSYAAFTIPSGKQYFAAQSRSGVRNHKIVDLAFHQRKRRFQVIRLDPEIEYSMPSGAHD
jgi:Novel STAND NTPase 1/FHA domain